MSAGFSSAVRLIASELWRDRTEALRRRAIWAPGLLLTMAATALAQAPAPHLPPAPAALTVPNPIPPPRGPVDLYQLPDKSDRFQAIQPSPQFPSLPIVFVPGFVYGTSPYYASTAPYFPAPPPVEFSPTRMYRQPYGGLWLETRPETAQVYVDGFYVGIVEDFSVRGRMLELPVGAHRIELRAPGYHTLVFDVTIAPSQVVRYRGDLQLMTPPAPAERITPSVPKTVYIIPKCYAGDKPPSGTLRQGCDVKSMRVDPKATGR
jgi:hypothetical protein